ncbi:MAG: AAA family ATPase, partial [Burkholderiaceae bacterium]|nr:AAA family ATPase [Burkholderiaceae bacterium]
LALLQAQDYPGNVRELRNLLERTALLCDGDTLEAAHVQQALLSGRRPAAGLPGRARVGEAASWGQAAITPAPGALQAMERAGLQQLVTNHRGSRAELAAQLGISERSLYRKLKKLG